MTAVLAVAAAWPVCSWAEQGAARPVFNVLDHGAKNDGSAPATDAFKRAIAAAKAAGGGMVFVPIVLEGDALSGAARATEESEGGAGQDRKSRVIGFATDCRE